MADVRFVPVAHIAPVYSISLMRASRLIQCTAPAPAHNITDRFLQLD